MRRAIAFALPFFVALITAMAATSVVGGEWPPKIKNLQTLPKETGFQEVMGVMKGFANSLGVRCQHCHVGEEGQALSEFDFAADDKPTKRKARIMLEMTRVINAKFLARLGEERAGIEVRCVTCHRGVAQPETIERIVLRDLEEKGLAAAVARYRKLREEYLGRSAYDFGEGPLNQLAEDVGLGGRLEEAVRLLELNLEFNPESSWAHSLLGEARFRQGDRVAARKAFERAIQLDPENSFARRRLEEIDSAEASGKSEGGR